MSLFDNDYFLHYFAFAKWRTDYETARAIADLREGLSETTKALELLANAAGALAKIFNEIDWGEIDDSEEDPAGRIDL